MAEPANDEIVLGALKGVGPDPVVIEWLGRVRYQSRSSGSMPKFEVSVASVDAAGIPIPSTRRDVEVPAAFLRLLNPGDIWHHGRQVGTVSLDREVFSGLVIDDATSSIEVAGRPHSCPDGSKVYDLDFAQFSAHANHTLSKVVRVEVSDNLVLIVPCLELLRFYFGASGSLISHIFSGALAERTLCTSKHLSVKTGIANLELNPSLKGPAAAAVGRIAFDRAARRAMCQIVNSTVAAGAAGKRKWYPLMGFPIVGRTDLTADGKWLCYDRYRVFVIHRLLQCTHPFPFQRLYYRSAAPKPLASAATTAVEVPEPGTQPVSDDSISHQSMELMSQQQNPNLASTQLADVDLRFEPFPDLHGKLVIRVSDGFGRRKAKEGSGTTDLNSVGAAGSVGGDLPGLEIDLVQAQADISVPNWLQHFQLKLRLHLFGIARLHSPREGKQPLLVDAGSSTDPGASTWIFCIEGINSTTGTLNGPNLLLRFRNRYIGGPGYDIHIFRLDARAEITDELMDQVSQFDPHELGKYAGDFRATYVEGGSGDEESAEEGIDNIAESVVKYFDAVVTDQYRHSVQAT